MLTVALSLLFGLVAFAAFVQICVSVSAGMKHGRAILAELATQKPVRARLLRPDGPAWRPAFAPASLSHSA